MQGSGTAVDGLNNLNIKYKVNVRKTKKIFKIAELTLYKQSHFKILPTGIHFLIKKHFLSFHNM